MRIRGGNWIPKQLFYGELKTRKHPEYKPKRFKDNLKDNLNAFHMNVPHWEELIEIIRNGDTLLEMDAMPLRMNTSDMLRSSMIYEESFTLICQLICSLLNVVCVSACYCQWQVIQTI